MVLLDFINYFCSRFRKRFRSCEAVLRPDLLGILCTVKSIDKVHPGNELRAIAPIVHRNVEALNEVNHYGNLSRAYCEALVNRYEDNLSESKFPLAIEKAIIDLSETHLIHYLTNAGHTWSQEARALMREKHPTAYEHNATVLPPREALVYLADMRSGTYFDIRNKVKEGLLWLYRDKGYVVKKGGKWYITDKGLEKANSYRKPQLMAVSNHT